jgi:hypothetical protein
VGDFLTVKRLCMLSPKQGTSNIFPLFVLGFVLRRSHLPTFSTWHSYIEEAIQFLPRLLCFGENFHFIDEL